MPTITSRPSQDVGGPWTVDEIARIITDAILYTMPKDIVELKLALHVTCRTLWNTSSIEDFYIHENPSGGCDVGFKLFDDAYYHVMQVK